ncbi:MAG: TolC family protein [Verrucomicrobiia bacterium]
MKRFSVLLVIILAAFSAAAQTDTNTTVVPVDTNASAVSSATNGAAVQADANAIVAPAETNAPAAQPDTNTVAPQTDISMAAVPTNTMATAATHAMSLDDCIQEALQHNLDVQISRFDPQIQLYTLRENYGTYDPIFDFTATHQRNNQGPEFQNGLPVPASTSDQNTFTPDLSGLLPWGMKYDLNGTVTDSKNINFTVRTNFTSFTNSTAQNASGSAGLTLTQPLLKNFWIDSTRLAIKLARNTLQQDEQGLRLQLDNSITAVENAYYELIYAQQNVKVQEEALVLAQTQLDQDRQRVQIGTLAQLDVQQDESQVATSRANLIAAQYTLANDQNNLKILLTDQYANWHNTDVQPTETITNAPLQLFDLQDSWSKGLTKRPDLLQSRLAVEAQGITLKYDRNQLYPELNLTGSYGYNGQGAQYNDVFTQVGNEDRPFYSYGAELNMPLSNAKARNTYKADKVTLQQLLLKMKKQEQTVMVGIDNALKQAQSDYQSVQASRQARIYAEAALDAEQKKYAVGKSTTFTVLQLQNTLTTDRGIEIRDLANYYEDLSNLAQQEGTTLERHRIDIEVK